MKTRVLSIIAMVSAVICTVFLLRAQNPIPEVRFYYAITQQGAYELAGFSNAGDFSRWFYNTQWTTNENMFVIATPIKVDDIEVPYYTMMGGKALTLHRNRIHKDFTEDNFVIPKVHPDPIKAISMLVSNHTEVLLSTNDLLPEQVHVIGPDGKTYLSVHSDSFDKLKRPHVPSAPAVPPQFPIRPIQP